MKKSIILRVYGLNILTGPSIDSTPHIWLSDEVISKITPSLFNSVRYFITAKIG